ncbi:MAG: hypothetical protein ABI593_04325 [Betaproteobacteria bacterium]
MSLETWMAFALASVVLLVISGPTILTVISYLLAQFPRHDDHVARLLAFTFVVLATVNAALYAVFAASAQRALSAPVALRRFNIAGGLLPTGAGVWALLARRAAPGA